MNKVEMNERKLPPFSLRSIYMRQSKMHMSPEFDPTIPGQLLVGEYRTLGGRIDQMQFVPDKNPEKKFRYFRFVTNYEFKYSLKVKGSEPNKLAAEISAEIAIDYLLLGSETPDEKTLEQWAQGNVQLHTWPYWREFCQNSLCRMSLPVMVMPMLNVQQPPPPEKSD